MAEIIHIKPPEMAKTNSAYLHRLVLQEGETPIGNANLTYRNKPFPHYLFSFLFVEPNMRNQGYGSVILEGVNEFLLEKKRAGLLFNIIKEEGLREMCIRHGWTPLPGRENWQYFNLPNTVDPKRLHYSLYSANQMTLRREKLK